METDKVLPGTYKT